MRVFLVALSVSFILQCQNMVTDEEEIASLRAKEVEQVNTKGDLITSWSSFSPFLSFSISVIPQAHGHSTSLVSTYRQYTGTSELRLSIVVLIVICEVR